MDFPFAVAAERILEEYHTARFYAGLNENARTALTQGKLAFADLTPDQQRQALYLQPKIREALETQPVFLGLIPDTRNPVYNPTLRWNTGTSSRQDRRPALHLSVVPTPDPMPPGSP